MFFGFRYSRSQSITMIDRWVALDHTTYSWPWLEQSSRRSTPSFSPNYCFCAFFVVIAKHTRIENSRYVNPGTGKESSSGPQLICTRDNLAFFRILVAICNNKTSLFTFSTTYLVLFTCPFLGSTWRRSITMDLSFRLSIWSESWSVAKSIQHLHGIPERVLVFVSHGVCACERSHFVQYVCSNDGVASSRSSFLSLKPLVL